MLSSPLKQTWMRSRDDTRSQSPEAVLEDDAENYLSSHDYDRRNDFHENDEYNGHDDQNYEQDYDNRQHPDDVEDEEPASSPFRYQAREDTVDFQKMRPQTNHPHSSFPGMRHRFAIEEEDEPPSSPFRPNVRDVNEEEYIEDERGEEDEEEGEERLRDVQRLSPGLDRRLAYEDPVSSPFRADVHEDDVGYEHARDMSNSRSPVMEGLDEQEEQEASSPFRPDIQEELNDGVDTFEERERSPVQNEVISREEMMRNAPADALNSPFRPEIVAEMTSSSATRVLKRESFGGRPTQSPKGPRESPFRHDRENSIAARRAQELQQQTFERRLSASKAMSSKLGDDEALPARRDSVIANDKIRSRESLVLQRESFGKASQSPTASRRSSGPQTAEAPRNSPPKARAVPRASLGLENHRASTTPQKRPFDQTPHDHDEHSEEKERYKKGMVSRDVSPAIHADFEEEPSVIRNQSYESATGDNYDRSTVGNSVVEDRHNEGMSTVLHNDEDDERFERADMHAAHGGEDHDPVDDTGFSDFSVLPDMTSFAKLRADSPVKAMRGSVGHLAGPPSASAYRHSLAPSTPGTARKSYRASALLDAGSQVGSPTPRRRESRDVGYGAESSNLLDLTDQMNFYPRQSMPGARYSPNRRSPMRAMRQSIRTPSKMSSLLDFDIPPAPTPRSLPSITPRELESLKSGFMSEISSLKATLSGKEAEVASLKTAVADAERRVGEALEEVRNEAARKDELEMEQAEWDRRGKEMETVLRSVRDELENGEHERERLVHRAEEAEKSKEHLEGRVVELETQLTSARASSAASAPRPNSGVESRPASQSTEATAREVQEAVEKVARELHTLYKSKHETKVAALKKSYETRWEKRLREVEKKLAAALEESDRLRIERDTAQAESMAAANANMGARENDEYEAEKQGLEAQIQGLQHEIAALKEDGERLRSELKSERAEKGELVAAVDEWLAMQQGGVAPAQGVASHEPSQVRESDRERQVSLSSAGGYDEERRVSPEVAERQNPRVGRAGSHSDSRSGSSSGPGLASSGMRAAGAGEKRIPRFGAPTGHSRGQSGNKSGIATPTPGRGGIMSSIERMGRGTGGV